MLCWYVAQNRKALLLPCVVYWFTLCAMYACSMLSHAVKNPAGRERVRALDQGVIYTFIAGTFTPFVYAYLSGGIRLGLIVGIWVAAASGFYSKVFAKHRVDNMTAIWYILLGWIPAMFLLPYVPTGCFLLMALGGVLYTVGTLFLQNDHVAWCFHAIWHLMVILASACHFIAVYIYCVLR